jgi:RNA polymerase sigma-70 factor (ECF subfamily)
VTRPRAIRGFAPVTLDTAALVACMPYVRALLCATDVPPQDQEDLVQEIIAAAWSAVLAARFRPDPTVPRKVAVKWWLSGIARRQLGTYRQRMRQRHREVHAGEAVEFDLMVPVTLHVPAPDGAFAAREILGAMARIPLSMRTALTLHYLEGWTIAEVAELLQIPAGTAATRIRRGVQHFIRAVQRWRFPRS